MIAQPIVIICEEGDCSVVALVRENQSNDVKRFEKYAAKCLRRLDSVTKLLSTKRFLRGLTGRASVERQSLAQSERGQIGSEILCTYIQMNK